MLVGSIWSQSDWPRPWRAFSSLAVLDPASLTRNGEGSTEQAVQKPGQVACDPALAVAAPEDPETLPGLVLELEIVPDGVDLAIAPPPLAEDALRPVRTAHPAPLAAPGEGHRRLVGQESHRVYGLGPLQQACRTGPANGPGLRVVAYRG